MRTRYRIYRNLHRGCFSIQEWFGGKGYRVIDWAEAVVAEGVSFKVYEAGRRKVLAKQKKNVHAFVCCDSFSKEVLDGGEKISYNPFVAGAFLLNGQPIFSAAQVSLREEKMFTAPS